MTDCEVIVNVEREVAQEEGALRKKPVVRQMSAEEIRMERIMKEWETSKQVVETSKVVQKEEVKKTYESEIVIERETERALVWVSAIDRYGDICTERGIKKYSVGELIKNRENYFIDVRDNTTSNTERVVIGAYVLEFLQSGLRAEEFRGLVAKAVETPGVIAREVAQHISGPSEKERTRYSPEKNLGEKIAEILGIDIARATSNYLFFKKKIKGGEKPRVRRKLFGDLVNLDDSLKPIFAGSESKNYSGIKKGTYCNIEEDLLKEIYER